MLDLTGKTIGKYELTARLGQGGMATVYKAHQPTLDRNVALKVMHPGMGEDEGFLARFKREAAAVARLRHPNIVQVYDFDVDGDNYFMVMEFVEGTSLKRELSRRNQENDPFSLAEIVAIFDDVAQAVEYAHNQGMIHRDLKPGNIMLNKQGRAFLTDFGIARLMGASQMTMTGAVFGTPAYMSPEQGQGLPSDERSDIYALGVILYKMLTGKVPFEADTPMGVIMKHLSDPLPPPGQINQTIPKAVEAVVLKALSKAPEDRYQTAATMATALQEAVATTQANPDIPTFAPKATPELPTDNNQDDTSAVPVTPISPRQPGGTTADSPWEPPAEWAPTIAGEARRPKRQPKPLAEPPAPPPTTGPNWNKILFGAVLILLLCIATYMFVVVNLFGNTTSAGYSAAVVLPTATDRATAAIATTAPATNPAAATATLTAVPLATATFTTTPTPSQTPTATTTPVLLENCEFKPDSLFMPLWNQQKDEIGCPTANKVIIPTLAEELFEGGHMFWRSDTDQVYLVYDRRRSNGIELFEGEWETVAPDLKWDGSNPDGVGLNPPAGLVEPKRGFGWLWRNHLDAEDGRFGWAIDREYGFDNLGQAQLFERGLIFKGSSPKLYLLLADGNFIARP